jgi:hypothetical protein
VVCRDGCYKSGDSHACLPNWANGGWAEYNTKTSFFQVAPYSGGTVYVQFKYGGTTLSLVPVFQGQWWTSWAWSSKHTNNCCFLCGCGSTEDYDIGDHRWDLVEASGKEFHWSYAARWNCNDDTCNNTPVKCLDLRS